MAHFDRIMHLENVPISYFGLEKGLLAYTGRDWRTASHAPFFIEVAFSLSGSLTIGTHNQRYADIRAAIIGSNVRHTFSCRDGECQLLFLDPTTDIGGRIAERYDLKRRGFVAFDAPEAEELKRECGLPALEREARLPRHFPRDIDERIRTV